MNNIAKLFKTISIKFISLLLCIILFCGNLLSCVREEQEPDLENFTLNKWYRLPNDSYISFIYEDTLLEETLLPELKSKYQTEIDDIYASYISLSEFDEICDFEGLEYLRELDVKQILADLAIGAAVVLVCVSLPALIPGMPAVIATMLVAAPSAALIGAAIDAAVSGVISYFKNNGNITDVFYDSLEGGARGFKVGAIFAAGGAIFKSIQVARHINKIRRHGELFLKTLPASERIALYNLTTPQYHYSINSFRRTGQGFLNNTAKTINNNAAKALNRTQAAIPYDTVAYRGTRTWPELDRLMGSATKDINGRISLDSLKALEGKVIRDNAFLHSSLNKNVSKWFADDLMMEIFVPKGTKAIHMGTQSMFGFEDELLMAPGQLLKFGKAYIKDGIPTIQVVLGEAAGALPYLEALVPAAAASPIFFNR